MSAWDVPSAWRETTAVVAAVYGVAVEPLRAPSKGRGPRPPAEVWEAKKVAIYVTVCLTGASYAQLGRYIGLSRDTVATHVAEMRDDAFRDLTDKLQQRVEKGVKERLGATGSMLAARLHLAAEAAESGLLMEALRLTSHARSLVLGDEQSTDAHPTPSKTPGAAGCRTPEQALGTAAA